MNKIVKSAVVGSVIGVATAMVMECKNTGCHKKMGKKLLKVMEVKLYGI